MDKNQKYKQKTMENPEEIPQWLLSTIPLQSGFQPKPSKCSRQSMILEDAQVPQEAQDQLSSLLQNKFNSVVSKSSTGVGRTSIFEMDIPTRGIPIACKLYLIPLIY